MPYDASYDAVVVGSGPNGLAAAITLAQEGLKVALLEKKAVTGGGMWTEELTLPGFKHDVGSTVHPFGVGSPFFRTLPLEEFGLEWLQPDAPFAHPLDDGVAVAERSLAATCRDLGKDADTYDLLMRPLVRNWKELSDDFLGRSCVFRPIRSRWRVSACGRCPRRRSSAACFKKRRPRRSLLAWPRTQ